MEIQSLEGDEGEEVEDGRTEGRSRKEILWCRRERLKKRTPCTTKEGVG